MREQRASPPIAYVQGLALGLAFGVVLRSASDLAAIGVPAAALLVLVFTYVLEADRNSAHRGESGGE